MERTCHHCKKIKSQFSFVFTTLKTNEPICRKCGKFYKNKFTADKGADRWAANKERNCLNCNRVFVTRSDYRICFNCKKDEGWGGTCQERADYGITNR